MDTLEILKYCGILFVILVGFGLFVIWLINGKNINLFKKKSKKSEQVIEVKNSDAQEIKNLYIDSQKKSKERHDKENELVAKNKKLNRHFDFINFKSNIVPESEISKFTINDQVPKLKIKHSKYKIAPTTSKTKKLSITKLRSTIKNLTPEMQALMLTDILDKKE